MCVPSAPTSGAALGVGGHMKSLIREAVGPFLRADALPLDNITPEALVPMEQALHLPTVPVTDEEDARLDRGQTVAMSGDAEIVALTHGGRLRALARRDGEGGYHPFRVFAG